MSAVATYLIPTIGLIGAQILFLSPLKSALKVARTRCIGKINPFPWPLICGNCYAWMLYSTVTQDLFLYWSNFPGFLLGMYYTSSALASDIAPRQLRLLKMTFTGCMGVCHLGLMLTWIVFRGVLGPQTMIAGSICMLQLLGFYISPMATLRDVFKTRDSSTLDYRLALVMCVNGAAWCAYGFFRRDPFLFAPNTIGTLNGAIQLACCRIFRRTDINEADSPDGGVIVSFKPPMDATTSTAASPSSSTTAVVPGDGFGLDIELGLARHRAKGLFNLKNGAIMAENSDWAPESDPAAPQAGAAAAAAASAAAAVAAAASASVKKMGSAPLGPKRRSAPQLLPLAAQSSDDSEAAEMLPLPSPPTPLPSPPTPLPSPP